MSGLIFRRAFSDGRSLEELCSGNVPTLSDVRRRIFVEERSYTRAFPDHFLKNYQEDRLGQTENISRFATDVLFSLADRYLERRNGRIRIRADRFADWHQLLPTQSPLAVTVAFLVKEGHGPGPQRDPRDFLRDEIGDTALLSPDRPALEDLVERAGLNEMHMHLNGSTEADIIWPDAIGTPEVYLKELDEAHGKAPWETAELFDQIEVGVRPYELFRRFSLVRRMRHAVAQHLRCVIDEKDLSIVQSQMLCEQKLLEILDAGTTDGRCEHTAGLPLRKHPAHALFAQSSRSEPLIDEAVLLYVWLSALKQPQIMSPPLGLALYANFLAFNLLARISVQQTDEVGFDQFQKYTLIGVREHLERKYENRFRQLNIRRPYRVLTHLEGRLAPKDNVGKQLTLLDNIVQGFLTFRGCPRRLGARGLRGVVPPCLSGRCSSENCPATAELEPTSANGGNGFNGRPDAELSLVVHFIKRKPNRREVLRGACLDVGLRSSLEKQAECLSKVMEINPFARSLIGGIDAAANELHAAPEVFAPIFRKLRHDGLLRATYHVGEDFLHLASGIRAIAEARRYLDLGAGDRIGHATAIGISPRLWLRRVGLRMMMPVGEHLDDLVFAYMELSRLGLPDAQCLLEKIAILSGRLYGREQSPALLYQAWTLRYLDILAILALERSIGLVPGRPEIRLYAEEKAYLSLASATRREFELIADSVRDQPDAYRLFRERHQHGGKAAELIEVDTRWVDEGALSALQEEELRAVDCAGLTLETLPTSNLRISFYESMKEHHLFRWLGLTDDAFDKLPAVCVGSDDTGIFATNLLNEYGSILDVLCRDFSVPRGQAVDILERLNATGFAHRFRPS